MASIEEDIVAWAATRPHWQQNLLGRIARGQVIDEHYLTELARGIIDGTVALEDPGLRLIDIPTSASAGERVALLSIGELKNVNALLQGQTLTFGATGLTVVYGDNGSGKSGYARLIKDAVGARHHEQILPNAYEAAPSREQSAQIGLAIGDAESSIEWPVHDDPALAQISFYDEACGDVYLVSESELTYRPSVLNMFDDLIRHTHTLRDEVDRLLADNAGVKPGLPSLEAGTKAAAFLEGLSHRTTEEAIDGFLVLPADAVDQQAVLLAEEARLKGTDPTKEKARLTRAAIDLKAAVAHLEAVARLVGPSRADTLLKQRDKARELRTATTAVSAESFKDEPLVGVGGEAWRALWDAAGRYSEAHAYPGREFPAGEEHDRCVLCQQPLGAAGSDRMARFHNFVHNDIARQAADAEKAFSASAAEVNDAPVFTTTTTGALAYLLTVDAPLAARIRVAIEKADTAKVRIGARLRGESTDAWVELDSFEVDRLRKLAADAASRSEAIDAAEFKKTLAAATKARQENADLIALVAQTDVVKDEWKRLCARQKLDVARKSLSTTSMTTKSTELSRTYVTEAVSNQYIREADRLKLDQVVLGDQGGTKGRLRHKPKLEGAQGHSPREVLSEGEQTAAGLAGLFTEAHFDETRSAIVLDDPVSSLDHERRRFAARQATALAANRQVIIFTHDLTFLSELVAEANDADVPLTERTIERDGRGKPGRIIDGYPWKARDAKKRLGDLRADLARIKRERAGWSSEENERQTCDWAGRLSETWERFVRTEVAQKVVDRGTNEVRPKMFRILAQITPEDDADFQAGYSAASLWARRHDKSDEVNLVVPSIDEMTGELERADAWYKRVSSYK